MAANAANAAALLPEVGAAANASSALAFCAHASVTLQRIEEDERVTVMSTDGRSSVERTAREQPELVLGRRLVARG